MKRQELVVSSSIIITVLLFLPAIALAEDYTWSDNGDGTCTINEYIGPGGDVIIPDTLGGLTVTAIGDLAFYECDWVSSVTILDNVISIGYEAFLQADGLLDIIVVPANPAFSSVDGVLFNKDQTELFRYPAAKTGDFYDIPYSVMAIGKTAFEACYGLTSVTIPAGVISIGDRVFHNCKNLSNITVDEANPAYMSEDGVLFDKNQTEIIKYSPAMLGDSYTVPNTITSIADFAFVQSTNLTSVIIPDGVTAIGFVPFGLCTNLPEITVDPANPAYMSKAGVLFNKSQTELVEYPPGKAGGYTIPDSVIAVRYGAFATSINLTSVITPDSVTSIGDYAFAWCQNLTGVYFRGDTPTLGGVDVFEDSNNATVYYIPETVGWGPTFGGRPTMPWPLEADVDLDGAVTLSDYARLAEYWMESNCQESNNWCERADIDMSGDVGLFDFIVLTNNWLDGVYPTSYCLDNFDDNIMGSIWTMMATNEPNFWLDETNQRLEVKSTGVADGGALYVPNGWYLVTSQDFGFKIRYHNEVVSETWSELLFALGDPSDIESNHLQFSVCSLDDGVHTGPHFYYELKQNSSQIDELYIPRASNDGWIFTSYDAVLDEVYFGINGYGPANAVKMVSGLLQGDWAGKYIGPHIGGGSDHVEMVSGQAFWDDFIVDYGEIITE